MSATELEVLVEQLDEVMAEPVMDEEDAIERAILAGLVARLDPRHPALIDAEKWRDGEGKPLLDEAFGLIDEDDLIETLDSMTPDDDAEAIEEAVMEVDELLCAAVWSKRPAKVRGLARRAAASVRATPEVFITLVPQAKALARLPAVAEHIDLYDLWLAVADAAQWAD